MNRLTSLEGDVIGMLLAGDDSILMALRAQAEHLIVSSREMTGVGFVTEFAVSGSAAQPAVDLSFPLGDVSGTADGVRHGFGFSLWIENGRLHTLEGYTYDEPWPDEIRGLKLSYEHDRKHDLEVLRRLKH